VATQDTAVAPKEERTVSLQRSIYDPGYVNAMSHFYRGELGRSMVWRQRLDVTTNWAITSSTAIITIAFSTRGVPHIIFFFNLAIVGVLLWIESRRYRFYDAFRARIRMLEAHFLVPMVLENRELLQGEWKKLVCEDLILQLQDHEIGSNRAPAETELRVHFRPDLGRVADENLFARHRPDHRCRIVLSRAAHRTHPVVGRGDGFRGHVYQCHFHHHLRQQTFLRRNLRVRHAPLALAHLRRADATAIVLQRIHEDLNQLCQQISSDSHLLLCSLASQRRG
jgi:hypothetical protein